MDYTAATEANYPSKINAVKETPFTRLSGAVERLRKAEAMTAGISSKLVGEVPAADSARTSAPVGSGLFGGIEELADAVSDLADSISNQMRRIENRL